MKELKHYKDILHKCSKCGLCQAVCPVFKLNKNECNLSRGLIIMLGGVIKGDLSLKDVNKYLDGCITCNICKESCPSEIDISEIATAAKIEYFKSMSIKSYFIKLIQSKYFFGVILGLIRKLFSVFYKKSLKRPQKAVYFIGCKTCINPKKINETIKILNDKGIEVIVSKANCCGYPFLKIGNFEQFEENAKINLKNLPSADFYLTDCENCKFILNRYRDFEELQPFISNTPFQTIDEI